MTYVVKEECINCQHMDCVKVCPTDCFRKGENMLVIFPADCIDCGLCVPECPIDAIAGPMDAADDLTDNQRYWLELNAKYAGIWPEITQKGEPPADAESWKDVPDKINYFSTKPGKG